MSGAARAAVVLVCGAIIGALPRTLFDRIERGYRAWLGATSLRAPALHATVVTVAPDRGEAGSISSLDAALFVRAIARHKPRFVVIAAPIRRDADAPLISGVLEAHRLGARDAVFCAGATAAAQLPNVRAGERLAPAPAPDGWAPPGYRAGVPATAARGGFQLVSRTPSGAVATVSLAATLAADEIAAAAVSGRAPGSLRAGNELLGPVDAAGCARANALVPDLVVSMALDRLIFDTERSEGGLISPRLTAAFRDRIAVLTSSTGPAGGAEFAVAAVNRLVELPAPGWSAGAFVLAVAAGLLLPLERRRLAVAVLGGLLFWLLLAMGIYQQYRIVLPAAGPALIAALGVAMARGKSTRAAPG